MEQITPEQGINMILNIVDNENIEDTGQALYEIGLIATKMLKGLSHTVVDDKAIREEAEKACIAERGRVVEIWVEGYIAALSNSASLGRKAKTKKMNSDIYIFLQVFANELTKVGKMREMSYGELYIIIEKIRNEILFKEAALTAHPKQQGEYQGAGHTLEAIKQLREISTAEQQGGEESPSVQPQEAVCTLPNCDCQIISSDEGTSFAICKHTGQHPQLKNN